MEAPKRFVYHSKGIFFYYRFKEVDPYYNEYTKSKNIYRDGWYVGVQLHNKMFEYETSYYDGMEVTALTILGIRFIKGYDYEWENLG